METTLKIFLVDDDLICLNIYKKHLENTGYTDVSCFESGEACLNLLIQNPDVIFLDYEMNSLSGLEVLKKIKRFNPDIFIVFLSGQENIATAVNALKYGAFDYIVKSDGQLLSIQKVLNKIAQTKQLMLEKKPGLLRKLFFPR